MKPPGLPPAGPGSRTSKTNRTTRLGDPDAKEDKHTSVITMDDLQRLREQVGLGGHRPEEEVEAEFMAKQRKEQMERSRQRIKNWPNTIENLRQKRIDDKFKRLEEAEVRDKLMVEWW
jgi:hypothetical protein